MQHVAPKALKNGQKVACEFAGFQATKLRGLPAGRQDGAPPSAPSPAPGPTGRQRAGGRFGRRDHCGDSRSARPGPRCRTPVLRSHRDDANARRGGQSDLKPSGARTRRCTPGPSSPCRPESSSAPGPPASLTGAADRHRPQPGRAVPPGSGRASSPRRRPRASGAAPGASPQRRNAHQRAAE